MGIISRQVLLVAHFRHELHSHEADFLLGVVGAKFLDGSFEVVAFTLAEVFKDVLLMVFVHNLVEEVVDIDFSA